MTSAFISSSGVCKLEGSESDGSYGT